MNWITGKHKSGTPSMAHRPPGPEKIKMDHKRFGYFPQQFTWRGRHYDVHAVERCWTVSRARLGNKVERLCFRVRCVAANSQGSRSIRHLVQGTFDLYQDLKTNTWFLEKVVSRPQER